MSSLRLRPLRPDDADVVLAAHRVLAAEGFTFALHHADGMPWDEYLAQLDAGRCGGALPPGRVPATFLLAEHDGTVVGRVSVRFALNDQLLHEGGHIGFAVLPEHRRKGHASEMLRQGLVVARAAGVGRVLVCCDDDNLGSANVIERCGGRLESTVIASDGVPVRRYWID